MPAPKGNQGIYKITSPLGRIYIGQSVDIRVRFSKYRGGHCKGQVRLNASFEKYGVNAHEFEVIENCHAKLLNEKERFYQDKFNVTGSNGLNCKLTEANGKSGRLSKETKNAISMAHTGKKATQETRARMSKARIGKRMPEDQRLKMVGRQISEQAKEKHRKRMMGNQFTKGVTQVNARQIIDVSTGAVYESTRKAALYLGIKQRTLKAWLDGQSKNKSTMEFI